MKETKLEIKIGKREDKVLIEFSDKVCYLLLNPKEASNISDTIKKVSESILIFNNGNKK
jgi:hypothetical protein